MFSIKRKRMKLVEAKARARVTNNHLIQNIPIHQKIGE
jgi:hypothetical protein